MSSTTRFLDLAASHPSSDSDFSPRVFSRDDNTYVHEMESFPAHLAPFAFEDPRKYLMSLGSATCSFDDPDDEAAFRFQPGNWLRRWQVSLDLLEHVRLRCFRT